MDHVTHAIERLKRGERIIASDATLDAISDRDPDFACDLRSAINRKRVGTLDTYVVWACDEATPRDLTIDRASMVASASL